MPTTGRTFYIAGAGIAGLSLALALAKYGATAVVLERNAALSEFGAGLQISPNARRILDQLGLYERLSTRGFEPNGIDIIPFGAAKPLITLQLGEIMRQRFGAPYTVMHRADLVDALYKACRRFANIDINFGVRSFDAESHARGVTIAIDEANGQTRTVRGNALIGADGVHSKTRLNLLAGPAAHYGGRAAWRTLLSFDSIGWHIARDRVSVLFGPDYHMVCYPLPHRQQVNIALFAKAPADTTQTRPTLRSAAKSSRITALLAAAGDSWTPWPLYTVDAPEWHRGNIGLIGDAAHAMVPFQAQGAAMGIEDAAVLAPLLIAESNAEDAFVRYEAIRRARVTRVAQTSLSNGKIFHLPWPLSAGRNLVIKAQGPTGHLRRLDWLYRYDAQLPSK